MRALLGLILGLMLGSGMAAAFECADVTLPSSIVICSDPELMRLADERQAVIDEARARIGEDRWPALWENQKAWVRSYATTCGIPPDRPPQIPVPISVKECFKRAAEARIAFIRAYDGTEGASASSPATTVDMAAPPRSLKRSGDQRWVVLASRRDVDEAIGIARYYSGDFPSTRVVKANNSIYAVVIGPEHTTNIQGFRERVKNMRPIPGDAFLSRGDGWTEEVWRMRSPILAEVNYDGKNLAKLDYGVISLSVSRAPDSTAGGSGFVPVLVGHIGDKIVFTVRGDPDVASGQPRAHVFLIKLEPSRSMPQVVMTSSTGGAHCCTETHIATSDSDGRWLVLKADRLDGDGYQFEDLDGDDVSELVSIDNSFLYAFDCYACSYAPVRIQKLEGTRLRDVHRDYAKFLRQDLYMMEYSAERMQELWHSNGFLGGWVGAKALVGQFDDAWARMLLSYDHNSDWLLEECATGAPLDKCPAGLKRHVSFPEALRKHLITHGYIEGQETAAAAVHAVPAEPAITPPAHPSKPEQDEPAAPGQVTASGSGYIITSEGHLITNAHVVEGCRSITVSVGTDHVQARVAARDPVNDLALIASDLKPKSVAVLRTGVRLGESIAVFGFPLHGLLVTSGNFTLGNITAVAGIGDDTRMVQMSAPVQPGNSGGPLLDQTGNVIGTVVAKINAIKLARITNDLAENINFAIKSSIVTSFLEANGITYRTGTLANDTLSPPDLAARASSFSASVECRS